MNSARTGMSADLAGRMSISWSRRVSVIGAAYRRSEDVRRRDRLSRAALLDYRPPRDELVPAERPGLAGSAAGPGARLDAARSGPGTRASRRPSAAVRLSPRTPVRPLSLSSPAPD